MDDTGAMRIEEHIAALRREGERMADTVERADLDATVPTCPDWTVRELMRHLGRTHRWAAAYVRDHRAAMMSPEEDELAWGEMPDDTALVGWFREGHRRIAELLESAPADLDCWSFLPALSPLAFWARRQAHETAIHHADAQSAVGAIARVPTDFAVDGVDELLRCFFSRPRNRLRSETERTLSVAATDADISWLVHIGPNGASAERGVGPADCELRGSASDLYLGLWNRRPLTDLEIRGDATLLDLWRDKATVRWS